VVTLAATAEELQKHLLTREEELNSRKGTIVAWEDELTVAKHAHGKVCAEHDVECT
jgi:hypothetical protein